jgi:hypothetical protein
MTPKEKAKELVYRFEFSCGGSHEYQVFKNAKQCALISVDEILSFIEDDRIGFNWKEYYEQVKQEIQAL